MARARFRLARARLAINRLMINRRAYHRRRHSGRWDIAILDLSIQAHTGFWRAVHTLGGQITTLTDLVLQIGLMATIAMLALLTMIGASLIMALVWLFWLPSRLVDSLLRAIKRAS
jgi:hypothetical protein